MIPIIVIMAESWTLMDKTGSIVNDLTVTEREIQSRRFQKRAFKRTVYL